MEIIAERIVISSIGGAAESQGHHLGEYVEAGNNSGRTFYRQRDTEGTNNVILRYGEDGIWKWAVVSEVKYYYMLLVNNKNSEPPPKDGWFYSDGSKWQQDDSFLTVEFGSLDLCQVVNVFGIGHVTEQLTHSLGNYRSVEWIIQSTYNDSVQSFLIHHKQLTGFMRIGGAPVGLCIKKKRTYFPTIKNLDTSLCLSQTQTGS